MTIKTDKGTKKPHFARLTGVNAHQPPKKGGKSNLFDPPPRRGGGSKPTRKIGDGRFFNAKPPCFLHFLTYGKPRQSDA